MSERDRLDLDYQITKRLIEFYDGLIERGQIRPPIRKPAVEDADDDLNHCTAGLSPSRDPLRSEDAL